MGWSKWPFWAKALTVTAAVAATGTGIYYGAPHVARWIKGDGKNKSPNPEDIKKLAEKIAARDPRSIETQPAYIAAWNKLLIDANLTEQEFIKFSAMASKAESSWSPEEKSFFSTRIIPFITKGYLLLK